MAGSGESDVQLLAAATMISFVSVWAEPWQLRSHAVWHC